MDEIYPRFVDKQCEWIELYKDLVIMKDAIITIEYRETEYPESHIAIGFYGDAKPDIHGVSAEIPDIKACFKRLKHMVIHGEEYKEEE